MYEMNKLQVFQKKFRKNKIIGKTKKECYFYLVRLNFNERPKSWVVVG
jgi:hypothetical protein